MDDVGDDGGARVDTSSDEDSRYGDGGARHHGGFTFDISLASLHTYLGEVDDIHCRRGLLEGGVILTLPMLYLEGIVLFPEATLPLRVIRPSFKSAIERAMHQEDAPYTLGVIHVRNMLQDQGLPFALVGTTAEIRQYCRLEDGSMNVVTRGQQRFHLRRCWTDVDGAPCAEVQIIQEDTPLHIPRGAFGSLASVPHVQSGKIPCSRPSNASDHRGMEADEIDDKASDLTREGGPPMRRLLRQANDTREYMHPERRGDFSSSDEEFVARLGWRQRRSYRRGPRGNPTDSLRGQSIYETNHDSSGNEGNGIATMLRRESSSNDVEWGGAVKAWAADKSKWIYRAQCSAWPHWVYRMYDAYDLARRAADMWRQMVELPSMDDLVVKPEFLSFHIASKIPVPDAVKQELLEIDGVAYRLQREIQLLECIDCIRCKNCSMLIARRSDMMVMSTDGPIGAYVNPHGFVHETLTLHKTHGLEIFGHAEIEHSWFPGYAWIIANCSACGSHMGWLFTAVKKRLHPKSFWGVRRSQLADNIH